MRVLHVVPTYLPAVRYGGPIFAVHGLCKALAASGNDVQVFTTNVDGDGTSDVPVGSPVELDGVKVWYFASKYLRRLYYSPAMGRALNQELKNFDLVHLHSIFLWPTWAAARIARKENIPYVISPRGMLVKDLIKRKSRLVKSAWIALIEKMNLERASGIHVTSTLEEQESRKFGFRFPPFFVIPNGLDSETFLDVDSQNETPLMQELLKNGRYMLFLGRINWKKGLDRLIQALLLIPDIHLVIAGNDEEGYRGKLEGIAKEHGVLDRIIFAGSVYGRDKNALLKNASVFVLPSYSENFGNAVLEAMAAGCPVVVTAEVGLAEIVAENECGIISGKSPELIAGAINTIISDKALQTRLGENGIKTVRQRFSWERIAWEMECLYEKILREKGNT